MTGDCKESQAVTCSLLSIAHYTGFGDHCGHHNRLSRWLGRLCLCTYLCSRESYLGGVGWYSESSSEYRSTMIKTYQDLYFSIVLSTSRIWKGWTCTCGTHFLLWTKGCQVFTSTNAGHPPCPFTISPPRGRSSERRWGYRSKIGGYHFMMKDAWFGSRMTKSSGT